MREKLIAAFYTGVCFHKKLHSAIKQTDKQTNKQTGRKKTFFWVAGKTVLIFIFWVESRFSCCFLQALVLIITRWVLVKTLISINTNSIVMPLNWICYLKPNVLSLFQSIIKIFNCFYSWCLILTYSLQTLTSSHLFKDSLIIKCSK